jgi:tetratricopeptide (TPR) repeat protein
MHRLLQEVLKREVTTEDLKSWERRLLQHIKARAEFLWEGWVRHEHRWELGPLAACAWQWMERKTDEGAYLANGAAGPLQSLGKFADAEPLMRRALAIDEASFGPDHPRVARDLNNLAQLLQATNRLSDAEPLYRRALAVDEANFRSDHPNVANDLNNLAQLLQATNRLSDAEPLMRRNLEIFLQFTASTGYEHPYLRAAIANYAVLLREMGRSQAQIRAQLEGIRRRSACK